MRKLLIFLLALILTGCVTMRQTDGQRTTEYTSLFRTAQSINVDIPKGKIEVKNQEIDAEFIKFLNNLIEAARILKTAGAL